MENATLQVMLRLLNYQGFSINVEKFSSRFLSHPDLETMTAISDTFSDFDIDNIAVSVHFDSLKNFDGPFITLIPHGGQPQFALVSRSTGQDYAIEFGNKKKQVVSSDTFEQIFTGTILVVERNRKTANSLFKWLFDVKASHFMLPLIFLFFLASEPPLFLIGFVGLSLVGIYVTYIIVQFQLGNINAITSRVCGINNVDGCSTVLNSKWSRIGGGVGLSDISAVYFCTQITIVVIKPNADLFTSSTIFFTSVLALIFIPYSLYLQKFIIKKWCPLCLAVLVILATQGIMAAVVIQQKFISKITISESGFTFLVVCIITSLWYSLLPLLRKAKASNSYYTQVLGFRRNYRLLIPYLAAQSFASSSKHLRKIEIGNLHGTLELIMVSNPLCKGCKETYLIMEKLLQKYPDLSVSLVFFVPIDANDIRTKIAATILKKSAQGPGSQSILYNSFTIDELANQPLPPVSDEYLQELNSQRNWCIANAIEYTPTIIVNGKVFPKFYNPSDIEFHISELLAKLPAEPKRGWLASKTVLVDNT